MITDQDITLPWKTEYFREWGEAENWNGSFLTENTQFIGTRLQEYRATMVGTDIVFQTEADKLAFKLRYN